MEDNNVSDVSPDNPSGVSDNQVHDNKPEVVQYDTYRRTVNQMKRQKELNEELQGRLEALEHERKSAEEQKMLEKEEYKKLLDVRTRELEETKHKATQATRQLNEGAKLQAFINQLPSQLRNNKYLNWVDVESIAMDPETGAIDSESVKQVVDGFVKEHPEALVASEGPKIPGYAPGNRQERPVKEMSMDELMGTLKTEMTTKMRRR